MNIVTTARECARLEYLNSQEPGDASQANAIDIVDRLLEEDDMETCQKISIHQISGTKSVSTLGSKVVQCLAKRVDCSYQLQTTAVFDWFDTPNHGDCIISNICRENPSVHVNNQMPYLYSGTRAGAILECIDDNSGMNCLKKSELACATCDLYGRYDIGTNAQMAAEAKDTLFSTSTVSYDVRDIGYPESSSGKENKEDNVDPLNSPIQKLTCLPQSSGGMPTQFKQPKVDVTKKPNDESLTHSTNCCSESKPRKSPKQMIGKAKGSMVNGVLKGAINHELSEKIMGSGANDSKDDVIHPEGNRTYMLTSGSSKVEFSKATISAATRTETTEAIEPPTAKVGSISDPDTIGSTKMTHKSCLADDEASTNSTDDFDGTTVTCSKVRVVQKETSHSSQLEGTLFSQQEKQSSSKQNDYHSSVTSRVPLRETNGTGSQSRTHTSKKPLKKGLVRSPGSRELASLFDNQVPEVLQSSKRRKRHMSTVRVLFSQNMDSETIKDQTKILIHFGLPVATTFSEATHFVAEKFTRTRNMLEAIAMGIPVVTPLWLECCREARCFIDEKKYIVRDTKKEKELGFSMPISLNQACKMPLLEGRRVLITPNSKPSKELLKCLVVAASGKLLEKITASMIKNKNFEGAFVISCEQDYNICLPLIKNGLQVFESELLLNGIVTQKLEFERYRLFGDKAM